VPRKEAKISGRPINRGKPARIVTRLFVYGTLRKGASHPPHRTLAREARFAGTATFQGRLYDLGRYPGVVVSSNRTDRVYGEIYRLGQAAAVFKRLDRYEGGHFKRRRLPVSISTGKKISAWVYLYCGEVRENKRIRSGDYVAFRRIR
jgi:gamma-glutamylcyclotransferase (GGCT)/AIG2-like uncharacterized protein YtfP